jgi:hypothetical protein
VTSMPTRGPVPGTHGSAPGGGTGSTNETISARLAISAVYYPLIYRQAGTGLSRLVASSAIARVSHPGRFRRAGFASAAGRRPSSAAWRIGPVYPLSPWIVAMATIMSRICCTPTGSTCTRWAFPDPDTDIDETLAALSDLVRSGKIRSFGASKVPAS